MYKMSNNLIDNSSNLPQESENTTEYSSVRQEQINQPTNPELTVASSLQLLINSVNVAQKRGAYNLKEASLINDAVEFLANHINSQTNSSM